MAVNKYNKILNDPVVSPPGSPPPGAGVSPSGEENFDALERDVNAFWHNVTAEAFADMVFLGNGPHQKARATIKVSSPIPNRATVSNPEYYFDKTFSVYFDASWSVLKVYIQADTSEDFNPKTNFDLNTYIDWSTTGQYTSSGSSGSLSASSTKYVDISTPFITGGTGFYDVRIRFRGTTTAKSTTSVYLVGLAPRESVWAGIPNVDTSGKISYDMTIQMPDIMGVEDWEVEIAEA